MMAVPFPGVSMEMRKRKELEFTITHKTIETITE